MEKIEAAYYLGSLVGVLGMTIAWIILEENLNAVSVVIPFGLFLAAYLLIKDKKEVKDEK